MDTLISADQNRDMFAEIAARYDRMNRFMSLGLDVSWRKVAIASLAPVSGGRYLDVGCGTADICMVAARSCPEASITGLDPVEEMLEIGRAKVARESFADSITLTNGNALALPFADAELNGVVSGFCIRNITDRKKAFAEMHRVLAGSGRLVILELGVPGNALVRLVHRIHGACVVPMAARLAGFKGAYRYLIDSINEFAPPQAVLQELADAGFSNVDCKPLSGGIVNLFTGEKK